MLKVYTLLILFSCCCIPAFAQSDFRPGYVVTLAGDTITGTIDYRESHYNNKVCSLKPHQGGAAQEFTPQDIRAYGFKNDKAFEVKTIATDPLNSEKVFVELLVKGRLSLYMYADRFFVAKAPDHLQELSNKKEEIYVEDKDKMKGANEYLRVMKSSNEHIVTLNTLMNDCLSMLDKIERVYLSQRSLVALVNDYNNCVAPGESITFKEEKKWLVTKLGVAGAANTENISFSSEYPEFAYYNNARFNKRYYPSAGLVLNIVSPRVKERLSLQIEALYSAYDFIGYSEHTSNSGNTTYRNDYTLELSSLKFNTAFRYTFTQRLIQPYINLGISNRFLLSNKVFRLEEAETNKNVETSEHSDTFLNKHHAGIFGGVGGNYKLFKHTIFSEIRVDRGLNIASPPSLRNVGRALDGKSTTLSFIAGFYF